jgi:hypothetical protein
MIQTVAAGYRLTLRDRIQLAFIRFRRRPARARAAQLLGSARKVAARLTGRVRRTFQDELQFRDDDQHVCSTCAEHGLDYHEGGNYGDAL